MPFFSRVNDVVGDAISGAAAASAEAAARAAAGQAGSQVFGGSGVLRIEPDQLDAAIKIFQDAVDKLDRRVNLAAEQIRAYPMAADEVSRPAAAAFNDAAMSGPGAAIAAWTGAVKELQSIVKQLKAAKETQVSTDDAMAQPFRSASGTVS